jgi:hypothetical protein
VIPKQHVAWDERRNSSRVFPVPPEALPNALRALRMLHEREPELCAWITAGAPTLTEAEHEFHFGSPYARTATRSAPAPLR